MRKWTGSLIFILVLMLFCGCNDVQDSKVSDAKNSKISTHNELGEVSSLNEGETFYCENDIEKLSDLGFPLSKDIKASDVPTVIDTIDLLLPLTGYDNSMSVSTIPFKDVEKDYISKVGFLYENNIIFGVNNSTLGSSEPCDSVTFLVFVMRILGYDVDVYDEVFEKAENIRLITSKDSKKLSSGIFTFSDAAKIIYHALWLNGDAGNGKPLGSIILKDQSNVDFEYLDFDIYGIKTTPIEVIDFEKYKLNTSKITDSKNRVKIKYEYDSELSYKITEDGYLQLSGTQYLTDSHNIYFEKDILKQNNDYGMEFTLKLSSIGNEGSKYRTIVSIVPRTADKNLDGYYAINYYVETVYVEGMTSNLFKCKWSLTNTNSPTGDEPIVEKSLLLEENVDYKCRMSVENNDAGDVEIEFYIDGPNVKCNTFEPLIRYVDSSEDKITQSYHGPTIVYSARSASDVWGYPSKINLDDVSIYSIDDFKKNTQNYADYFGDEHCEVCHRPSLSNCSDENGIIDTVDFLIRQGVLPNQAHLSYQSYKPVKKIDLLKVLIYYRGYRFETKPLDSEIIDKALELNIIDKTFDVKSEYVSRNETSKLLYNISKRFRPVNGYTKLISDEVADKYEKYINYCIQNYYLKLDDNMAFRGKDNLSINDMIEGLCIIVNNSNKKDNKALSLPYVFSNFSVFQREKPIYIWGYGIDNDTVTVKFNKQTKTAKVVDGKWQMLLDKEVAGGPYTLTVKDSATTIERVNIYVGEVFILAGQSNMELEISLSDDYVDTVNELTNIDTLHYFSHEKTLSFREVESFGDWTNTYGRKYAAKEISGVGMFTTEMLYKLNKEELKGVRIGLIPISYGGSTIEVIMPPNGHLQYDDGPLYNSYYNGYINKIFPYSARAILYYQGENSVQLRYSYEPYLRQLITGYRKAFGDENLPFYMVQLAAYGDNYDDHFNTWPTIREIQMRTANTMDGVKLVSAIDLGDKVNHLNIHPTNKEPIGQRLAYMMSDDLFGADYNKTSPELKQAELVGDEYILTFDQDNIVIKEGSQDYNFDIYDDIADEWKKAIAYMGEDNKVHVKSELVNKPDGIRYAWYNYMDVVLFNSYDMPVLPFNTKADIENVPDFKEIMTDEDTLNIPIHLLETGDYIINVTKGFLERQVVNINANVVQLKQPISGQQKGDRIIRLKNNGQEVTFIGTDETKVVIKNHGLKQGDFIINHTRNNTLSEVKKVIDKDTFVIDKISNQTSFDEITILDKICVVFAE